MIGNAPVEVRKITVACPICGHPVTVHMAIEDLDATRQAPRSKSFRKYCTPCLDSDIAQEGHPDILAELPCPRSANVLPTVPFSGLRQEIDSMRKIRFAGTEVSI